MTDDRQALEQGDALDQRRLEGDLAVHGARGDGRDLVLEADFGGKLVDAFLADHGRIHVGDQQLLAAGLRLLDDDVDRRVADDAAQADGLAAMRDRCRRCSAMSQAMPSASQ